MCMDGHFPSGASESGITIDPNPYPWKSRQTFKAGGHGDCSSLSLIVEDSISAISTNTNTPPQPRRLHNVERKSPKDSLLFSARFSEAEMGWSRGCPLVQCSWWFCGWNLITIQINFKTIPNLIDSPTGDGRDTDVLVYILISCWLCWWWGWFPGLIQSALPDLNYDWFA